MTSLTATLPLRKTYVAEAGATTAREATREETINFILDAAEAKSPLLLYRASQQVEHKGTDGRWHGWDLPREVARTGETRVYWCSQSIKAGTTHGARFESREAWQANRAELMKQDRAEFRACLVEMHTVALQSQADFWLK